MSASQFRRECVAERRSGNAGDFSCLRANGPASCDGCPPIAFILKINPRLRALNAPRGSLGCARVEVPSRFRRLRQPLVAWAEEWRRFSYATSFESPLLFVSQIAVS